MNPSSHGLFNNLTELNGWSVKAYNKEEALNVMANESLNSKRTTVSVSRVASTPRSDIICCICLDSISQGHQMTGYALQSCNHWFCNECWCNHLVTRVEEGDRNLSCPGHECDTEVDTATLISLMPHSYFIRYESYVNNAKLEVNREWKWCQGLHGKCEQIIQATARKTGPTDLVNEMLEDRICVTCSCKAQWCFDCGKEPHWPATCEQAAIFIDEAVKRGHIEVTSGSTDLVNVKKCPNCTNPIEKHGGCSRMYCPLCHCKFCWQCLMPLTFYYYTAHECNRKSGTVDLITLKNTLNENKHSFPETEEAFKKAISWRQQYQHLIRSTKLKTCWHEWMFILQWSYALVYVSCLTKVCNNPLKDPLETLAFCAESVSKKITGTKKPIRGLEKLKKTAREQIHEICARMKPFQMAIMKADKTENKNENS